MLGLAFAVVFGIALWAIVGAVRGGRRSALDAVVMGGYAVRLVLQLFIRDIPFFSHGLGGDSWLYESYAAEIVRMWQAGHVHFVTSAEMPFLGAASLPPNIFALITYLNGGATNPLAFTVVVAFAAGLVCLNLYSLALQFGADKKSALWCAATVYFLPSFLFYTSDCYKDGLVLCLTLGALGSAIRLAYRFSVLHVAIGLACTWALWYVRFYLVFVTVAPLLVGLVGLGSKSPARPLVAALALATAAVAVAGFTDVLQLATERANTTFELATSQAVMRSNSLGGSGVVFDDGGTPTGALPAKLAYTLFSPFPWAAGSLGFQLGKLDAFVWYYLFYRAVRAVPVADRRFVAMLATFVVPSTVMYAMSMSNIGLILRQRLVIVAATTILAAVYRPAERRRALRERRIDPKLRSLAASRSGVTRSTGVRA